MENDFFKLCVEVMEDIERDSLNKVYTLNEEVNEKALALYEEFCRKYECANIEYNKAYRNICVAAKTYVFEVRDKDKDKLYNADIIGIDSTNDGMLEIECMFKNAFEMVGERVEE